MEKYKASKVFVPGGLPQLTYNPRANHRLEERLKEVKDNLCKLVMITGITKSGKTVLTNNVFPRAKVIWFDGGSFSEEEDFWADLVSQLDAFTDLEVNDSKENTANIGAELEGEVGIPFFKAKPKVSAEYEQSRSHEVTKSRRLTNKIVALTELRKKQIPLVIDDFHYIPRLNQGSIVRALKPLIFEGLPVIFIAIPHRRLDAAKVEKEMTGRIDNITIPVWTEDELRSIPDKGFPLLRVKISDEISKNFAKESFGSPHLMQEFCRELCKEYTIDETCSMDIKIEDESVLPRIYKKIAQNTGRVMFDKLAKGPRQRTDRLKRTLRNGKETDIYGAVLHALTEMRPGIQTIEYEDLRSALRAVLKENIPQAHEVTRVLEQMAKICSNDDASTPVIDWEKEERLLHITDPFFAYFLRWGMI